MASDPINLQSYSDYFSLSELQSIATTFEIDSTGKEQDALSWEMYSFIDDYDDVARKLSFDDVFSDPSSPDFGDDLRVWLNTRHGQNTFENLSEGEKTYWVIRYGFMDTNGNGILSIFENGDDATPTEFLDALDAIGADEYAKAFREVVQLMFEGTIPKTQNERIDHLMLQQESNREGFSDKETLCVDKWDSVEQDISDLITSFAANNSRKFIP